MIMHHCVSHLKLIRISKVADYTLISDNATRYLRRSCLTSSKATCFKIVEMNLLRDLNTFDRREYFVYLFIFGITSFSLLTAGGVVYKNLYNFNCFLPLNLLSSPKYAVGVGGLTFMVIIFRYLALVKEKCFVKAISWIFLRTTFGIELLVGIFYFKSIDSEDERFKNIFYGNHTTQSWNYIQKELQCCVNATNIIIFEKEYCETNRNDCGESLIQFYNAQNKILGDVIIVSLIVQIITIFLRTCIRCNCPDENMHHRRNSRVLPRYFTRHDELSLKSSENMSIGDARMI